MSQNDSDIVYVQDRLSSELELNKIDSLVGSKIRFYRKKYGLSQEMLAKQLNISAQQLQKYEKGVNRVSASRLFLLSKILKIKIQDLFNDANLFFGEKSVYGLAETPQAFWDENEDVLGDEEMQSAEAKELLRLYFKIKDPQMRQYLKAIMQGLIVEDNIRHFHE